MKKEFTIIDQAGLHARPASLLVQKANNYPNEINIIYNDKKVNLKSIMIVMSLGIPQGSKIEIEVLEDNGSILSEIEELLAANNLI